MKKLVLFILIARICAGCCGKSEELPEQAAAYPEILDIHYTPESIRGGKGWFTDEGSWMGFTLPEKGKFTNGFCGPYDLGGRCWLSRAMVRVGYVDDGHVVSPDMFRPDSMTYLPGRLYMESEALKVKITQTLFFVNKNQALLFCQADQSIRWFFEGDIFEKAGMFRQENNSLVIHLPGGEVAALTFAEGTELMTSSLAYRVVAAAPSTTQTVVCSFYPDTTAWRQEKTTAFRLLGEPEQALLEQRRRWNHYLDATLRKDMPEEFNRVAVKALVTLLSNWKSAKGDLLHDGIVPSHAVGYFMGFWAWDSWKHAVAVVRFHPELAKNQIRAMFDYQDTAGMVIDCIYADRRENNDRDSKPPLAAWSVAEVFRATGDTAFVAEMYPRLLKYYRWWYRYRDHDRNGICEYGSTDGTEEAAKWESGMDNAVRFDETAMVKNRDGAWSFTQESVDLNAYLFYEYKLLKQMADILRLPFDEPDRRDLIRDHFFDAEKGYFFDRTLKGQFVRDEGSEGWTPLWTLLATPAQAEQVMHVLRDTAKFSTYIPFPTLAANHPRFLPAGYWRGPIWLDQVYFGISGIRKYGYEQEADAYTCQVFTRLQGLTGDAPIHENYETRTGARLKAPHFSWSSAHLLMLYWEMGK